MNHDDYIIAREELAVELTDAAAPEEGREPTVGEVLDRMIETQAKEIDQCKERYEQALKILVLHDLQWKV